MEFKVMDYELYENKEGEVVIKQKFNDLEDDFITLSFDQLPLLAKQLMKMYSDHENEGREATEETEA